MKLLRQLVESTHHYVEATIPLTGKFPTMEEFDWINDFAKRTLGQTGKLVGAGSGFGGRDLQYEYPSKEAAEKAIWLLKGAARKAKLNVEVDYRLADYNDE
jgi:hypothetical protein